jgi:hypothetical protein
MTATAADFIQATGWSISTGIAQGYTTISLDLKSDAIPVPAPTIVGQVIKITADDKSVEYLTVKGAITPQLIGSRLHWVKIPITTVAASKKWVKAEFTPYVRLKSPIPDQAVKLHGTTSLNLHPFFEVPTYSVARAAKELRFAARLGGAQASATVTSGGSLRLDGKARGTATLTVTAYGPSSSRAGSSFKVTVAPADRAPTVKAPIGSPTVGIGANLVLTLANFFEDPDGDALSYAVSGQNQYVQAQLDASAGTLTITGLSRGDADLVVTATAGGKSVTQNVHVIVPPDRPPVSIRHVEDLALAIGGADLVPWIDVRDHFHDPDGADLAWIAQWEVGDPTKRHEQEFWRHRGNQGSSAMVLESQFAYPPGTAEPAAWTIPAATPFAFRVKRPGGAVETERGTVRSSTLTAWDATARKRTVTLPTTAALSTAGVEDSATDPPEVLLGAGADVAWLHADPSDSHLIDVHPGETAGTRTLWLAVYDPQGKQTSQLVNLSTGTPPTAVAIPDQSVGQGEDVAIDLSDYFTPPTGETLSFTVQAAGHVALFALDGARLTVHGLTAVVQTVTVTARTSIGLTVTGTFELTVHPAAGHAPNPIRADLGPFFARYGEEVALIVSGDGGS